MFSVLRRRNVALLTGGGLVSDLGDWVLFAALPFYVYTVTGSPVATGSLFVVQFFPHLCGSVAGVFVDRWDRRLTMIRADVIRSVVLLPLLLFHSPDTVWIIYPIAFMQASVGQFFDPARNAIVPVLVGDEALVVVNSLNSAINNVSRLLGPPLGGLLLGATGITGVVVLDSGSFLLSALALTLIDVQRGRHLTDVSGSATSMVSAWHELVEGMVVIRRNRVVRTVALVFATTSITEGILAVLFVVFVKRNLHAGSLAFGWILSAQAVGGLFGSAAIGHLPLYIRPARLLFVGCVANGALLLVIFNLPMLFLSLILFGLAGIAIAAYNVGGSTLLQTHVDDRLRGRVFGALQAVSALLLLMGIVSASILLRALSPEFILSAGGVLWLVAAVVTLPLVGSREALVEGKISARAEISG